MWSRPPARPTARRSPRWSAASGTRVMPCAAGGRTTRSSSRRRRPDPGRHRLRLPPLRARPAVHPRRLRRRRHGRALSRLRPQVEGRRFAGAAPARPGAHQPARLPPAAGRRHHRLRASPPRRVQGGDGPRDRRRARDRARRGGHQGEDQRGDGLRRPRGGGRRLRGGDRGGALIDELLARVAEWPPLLVYAVIAGSVVVENFFPPSPSDVFVLLAAFLSDRGVLHPLPVSRGAWGFGVRGPSGVSPPPRHFGRRFLRTPLGRRLVSPGAFAAIEREYLKFGVVGMFLFRLLPAFRAVVAPFAGFMNLGPRRALIPIALASGAWYGGLTLLGGALGAQWERLRAVFGHLNRDLGIAAVVVLALLAVWIVRRRREHRARTAPLAPFDPLHPDRPAPMVEGLPVISAEELEAARRAEREGDPAP